LILSTEDYKPSPIRPHSVGGSTIAAIQFRYYSGDDQQYVKMLIQNYFAV